MPQYECSNCRAAGYYDGRMGDGPVLTCGCDRPQQIRDRGGWATIGTTDAKPVPTHNRRAPNVDDAYGGSR